MRIVVVRGVCIIVPLVSKATCIGVALHLLFARKGRELLAAIAVVNKRTTTLRRGGMSDPAVIVAVRAAVAAVAAEFDDGAGRRGMRKLGRRPGLLVLLLLVAVIERAVIERSGCRRNRLRRGLLVYLVVTLAVATEVGAIDYIIERRNATTLFLFPRLVPAEDFFLPGLSARAGSFLSPSGSLGG